MKLGFLKSLVILTSLFFLLFVAKFFAASVSPEVQKAKKEAEAKGFIFETSHDDIVARAKKEGKLRVLASLDPDTIKPMTQAFKKKYPFIDASVEEITGTEGAQRFLLELKAGVVKDWDVGNATEDFYRDFASVAKKIDLLGMAEHGVLAFNYKMADPDFRTLVSMASAVSGIAYNRKLLPPEKVPNNWEDFLKPEFKGKKFVADIRPHGMAALIPGLGEEWVLNYARRIKEQDPIWVRGHTRALTGMISGEYSLHQMTNYHSCVRAMRTDRTQSLACKLIEPIAVRITGTKFIVNTAPHPNAALLWMEFVDSPEG